MGADFSQPQRQSVIGILVMFFLHATAIRQSVVAYDCDLGF